MKVQELELPGLKYIQLDIHCDARGHFLEWFQTSRFEEAGLPSRFYQDNLSRSKPGVVRGLHYQWEPAQGKLIGVIRGSIWDAVVDLRPHSPTYGKTFGIELRDSDRCLLWVPAGFAHGFCVLGQAEADVFYKVNTPYNGAAESGIRWSDPDLNIPWPVKDPIVSDRDRTLPTFAEYRQSPRTEFV